MAGEPFGKPFKYTDPYDLQTEYDREKPRPPWYKRWRKDRRPVAWAVVERPTNKPVTAHILHAEHGEVRSSTVEVPTAVPIYDETVVIAAAEAGWEREKEWTPHGPFDPKSKTLTVNPVI